MWQQTNTSDGLYETVYSFLTAQGHSGAAKALLKEAKLDEKKISAAKPADLKEVFASFK